MRENEISGYIVESISMIKSSFNRKTMRDVKNDETDMTVNLEIDNKISKTIARCTLTVNIVVFIKNTKEQLSECSVTSYGVFKTRIKEPKLTIEQFASLNAYAIMYPFIREHVSSLSLKAGMDVIMLPSVNFVAFLKNKKEQQESMND